MTRCTWIALPLVLTVLATVSSAEDSRSASAGRQFFNTNVLPKLAANGCMDCHSVGYVNPNVAIYEQLLRRLAIGDSATNNIVIYKLANLRSIAPDRPDHPGGQRCASVDAEPCASLHQWWSIEFGGKASGKQKQAIDNE